ncbi:MAG: DUF2778 domain-containing protein [Alphaproteobacteria bacterium]|nr:DUF2778 domain-containing protein [Alphaproteobacteria bacterium]
MRKLFLFFVLCMIPVAGRGVDVYARDATYVNKRPNVGNTRNTAPILFSVGKDIYRVQDIKIIERVLEKWSGNECIKNKFFNGNMLDFLAGMYKSCHGARNNLDAQLKKISGKQSGLVSESEKAFFTLITDKKLRVTAGVASVMSLPNAAVTASYAKDWLYKALGNCLVDNEKIRGLLQDYRRGVTEINPFVDLEACVNSVKVAKNVNGCPLDPTVTDRSLLSGWDNANGKYKKGFYAFPVSGGRMTVNKVMLYNGKILIACEGNKAKYIVNTAFSGLVDCQQKRYSGLPATGPIPDGVYLVRKRDMENPKNMDAWGGYRFPLIPETKTNTKGRGAMYLHGTSNSDKQQSAGCISLGTNIDDFVDTGFISGSIPVIVNYK